MIFRSLLVLVFLLSLPKSQSHAQENHQSDSFKFLKELAGKVGKDELTRLPKTEKKNGRFVVPELLSKGSKSSRQKKKSSGRRKSRKKEHDPKLAESLAKLKQNASATSMHSNDLASSSDSSPGSRPEASSQRSEERHQSRSKGSRSRRSAGEKGSGDRSRSRSNMRRSSKDSRTASRQKSNVLFADLMAVRSLAELSNWAGRQFSTVVKTMNGLRAGNEPNSKWDVMMIIIGFLIAVPALHLIMWWFIGIDPLGLARPTSYIAPFMVPTEMKAEIEEETDSISPTLTQENNSSPTFSTSANTAIQLDDGKLPTPKLDPSSVHAGDNN